jgi:ferritin
MMNDDLIQLANKAMQLEYNVSKLYMIFRDSCPEDTEFWWKLVIEESNHAALIKSGLDYFMPEGYFPYEIFPSMEDLQKNNRELVSLLEKYINHPPSREIAFNLALRTEMSAAELHFQNTMTKSTDSDVLKLFQKLNQDDKDHAKRIRVYMKEKGIEESETEI